MEAAVDLAKAFGLTVALILLVLVVMVLLPFVVLAALLAFAYFVVIVAKAEPTNGNHDSPS